jgi:hypothetical protein
MSLRARRISLAIAASTGALACSPAGPSATTEPCPVGDLSSPPELTVVVRTADGSLASVEDGGRVPLVEPPQGGEVVFVGMRARNVDACGVTVAAVLRDPASGAAVGSGKRVIDLRGVTGDGWAQPGSPEDIGSFANVAVCPSASATRDVAEQRYSLEVALLDRSGRGATTAVAVVPYCSEAGLYDVCTRECSHALR